MVKVFEQYTLDQFNENFGTRLDSNMTLEQFTDELENRGEITYYYASYNPEDIVATANDEDYALDSLFVYLIDDVYIATTYSI